MLDRNSMNRRYAGVRSSASGLDLEDGRRADVDALQNKRRFHRHFSFGAEGQDTGSHRERAEKIAHLAVGSKAVMH